MSLNAIRGDSENAAVEYAVTASVREANEASFDVEKLIGYLRDRLEPVLTARPESNDKAAGLPPSATPLSGEIDGLTRRLRGVEYALQDLLNRVQV